jgi:hypothetical protein
MQNLKTGDTVDCPRCGEQQDGLVEEHVLTGVGPESAYSTGCWNCDAYFIVTQTSPGEYRVTEDTNRADHGKTPGTHS